MYVCASCETTNADLEGAANSRRTTMLRPQTSNPSNGWLAHLGAFPYDLESRGFTPRGRPDCKHDYPAY